MLVQHDTSLFPQTGFALPEQPPTPDNPFWKRFGAGFQLESPVYSMVRSLSLEDTEPDPDFDFDTAARESQAFALSPDSFFGVRSSKEFLSMEQKILEEQRLRDIAYSGGFAGILGGMLGSLASPSTVLPGGTIFKGARMASVARSALSVGAAAAGAATLDEFILQQEQELRTGKETALNIIGSFVLGGLIGGAVSTMTRKEIARAAGDMALKENFTTIRPVESTSSIGAAVNPDPDYLDLPDVGQIAPSFPGVQTAMAWLNPVSRNLSSRSETVRALQASLDTGGLRMEGITNLGGDIESLKKQWYTLTYNALNERKRIMSGSYISRFLGVRGFDAEVSTVLRGGTSDNPAIQEYASWVRNNFFLPVLREAKAVKMPGFDAIEDDFAMKYVNRIVRKGLVVKDYDEFTDLLKEHFGEQLTQSWAARMEKHNELQAADTQAVEDLELDPEKIKQLRENLEVEIKALPEKFEPQVRDLAEKIRTLRAQARDLPRDQARVLQAEARQLEAENRELLKPFRVAENKIKQRFSRLGRTATGLAERQSKALKQLETLEEQLQNSRFGIFKQIEKIVKNIQGWDRKVVDAEIDRLEELVKGYYKRWMNTSARLAKLGYDLPEDFRHLVDSDPRQTDKASQLGLEERLAQQREALDGALDQLEAVREAGPELAQTALRNIGADVLKASEAANASRLERIKKLNERIKALDPENVKVEVGNIRDKIATRQQKFLEQAANANIKLVDGGADVSARADELAEYVAQVYTSERKAMPFFSVLEERGPELARMLNIDETRVWANGRKFEDFLESDIEYLMRAYIRTMGPDIELVRKFGEVNPLSRDSKYLKAIYDEFNELRTKARETLTGKALDKELLEIQEDQRRAIRDLSAVIDRIRHVRGLPQDAASFGYRTGKAMRNLNVVRLMGKMVISNIADLGGVVLRHGMTRTMKDGFWPVISNWKNFKLNAKEVQYAGVALDMTLHGRAAALYDVMDETRAGTQVERGLQWATNNMGLLSGMDLWNTSMKMLAGNMTITRISSILEDMSKGKLRPKDEQFLAGLGIDEVLAKRIWAQMIESGDRYKGIMLPNTEDWTDAAARRAFRAAIARNVDDSIITPGAERPLWMDGSEAGRLIGQFRSFTFSSSQKLLWAGAQNLRSGDMAPLTGITFSLALGALSYYLWAMTSGADRREEMQNADWNKWAAEAITRSFVLGPLAEVQRFAENLSPPVSSVATLGSGPTSRSPFRGAFSSALGPSMSLVSDIDKVAGGISGGEMTEADFGALRRLMPYNNLFWLGWAFDQVEKGVQQ